jgi:hypothetical protein
MAESARSARGATATKRGTRWFGLGGRNVWRSAVAVPTRNDATTGYRFAVTRWWSEVDLNRRDSLIPMPVKQSPLGRSETLKWNGRR